MFRFFPASGILLVFLACSLPSAAQCPSDSDKADYELSAASGNPSPVTKKFNYTRPNNSSVTIRLKDINPYHYKCGVSVTSTDVKEPDISSFTSLIGGVAATPGAALPAPAATPSLTPTGEKGQPKVKAAAPDCTASYKPTHDQVIYLHDSAALIDTAIQQTREAQDAALNLLKNDLPTLRAQSSCKATVDQAHVVLNRAPFDVASVPMQASPPPPGDYLAQAAISAGPLPLEKAVDALSLRAQLLAQRLTDNLSDECRTAYAKVTAQDLAFLNALATGSSSNPSAVSGWRDQVKGLATVRNNIIGVQGAVKAVLDNPENFTITRTIDGDQQIVTYTAKCDVVPEITAPAPASITAGAQPQPSPAPTPSPTPGTFTHDFKFGLGPRFALAGGVVISPLAQVTFSTTANPAASAAGSTAPANIITKSQDSGTRILPMAMLHGRFWDNLPNCDPEKSCFSRYAFPWLPSYFSAGVTAKSTDNNGTSIEYLLGPSWALVNRQVFITVGAYAGHQQRLASSAANPLNVGDATSLSAANLPLTLTTIWKIGFALSWAPAGK